MARKPKNKEWEGDTFQQIEMGATGTDNVPVDPQIEVSQGSGNEEPKPIVECKKDTKINENHNETPESKTEQIDYLQAINDYAKNNIYCLSPAQKVSPYFIKRIHNLIYNDSGYWGDGLFSIQDRSKIVFITLRNSIGAIRSAIDRNREKFSGNDGYRVNYIMNIITSNLPSAIREEMIYDANFEKISNLIKTGALLSPQRENKEIDQKIQEEIDKVRPQKELPDHLIGDPLAELLLNVRINEPKARTLEDKNQAFNEYW